MKTVICLLWGQSACLTTAVVCFLAFGFSLTTTALCTFGVAVLVVLFVRSIVGPSGPTL
jgi:hypothetical protein